MRRVCVRYLKTLHNFTGTSQETPATFSLKMAKYRQFFGKIFFLDGEFYKTERDREPLLHTVEYYPPKRLHSRSTLTGKYFSCGEMRKSFIFEKLATFARFPVYTSYYVIMQAN